jgi:hypothetical protein
MEQWMAAFEEQPRCRKLLVLNNFWLMFLEMEFSSESRQPLFHVWNTVTKPKMPSHKLPLSWAEQ